MSDYSQDRMLFSFSYAELEEIIKKKTGRLIHGEDRDLLLTALINNLDKLKVASDTAKESIYIWIRSTHHVTLPKGRDDDKHEFVFGFGRQIPACITYNGHVSTYIDKWTESITVIDQVMKLKPKFLEIFCQQELSTEDSAAMKKKYPWIKLTPIALGKPPSKAITEIKLLLCKTTPSSRGMAEFGWSKRKLAEKNDEEQPPKKKEKSLVDMLSDDEGDFEDNVATTEVNEQERKLKEVTARYEAAKEDMRRLKDKATAATDLLNRRIKELEEKSRESEEGVSVKEGSNNQIREKTFELEMMVEKEKSAKEVATLKWEAAAKEVSELKKAKEELEKQLEASRTLLAEMRTKYDKVSKDLNTAKEDLAKAAEKEKRMEKTIRDNMEQRRRNPPHTRNSPRTNMKNAVDRLGGN